MTKESQITQLEKRARGFRRIISSLNDLPMYGINERIDKILHVKIDALKDHLKLKITRNMLEYVNGARVFLIYMDGMWNLYIILHISLWGRVWGAAAPPPFLFSCGKKLFVDGAWGSGRGREPRATNGRPIRGQ